MVSSRLFPIQALQFGLAEWTNTHFRTASTVDKQPGTLIFCVCSHSISAFDGGNQVLGRKNPTYPEGIELMFFSSLTVSSPPKRCKSDNCANGEQWLLKYVFQDTSTYVSRCSPSVILSTFRRKECGILFPHRHFHFSGEVSALRTPSFSRKMNAE